MKDKILFVCQRYGIEINGGAEMECRAYAEHLADRYEVSVLTTCAIDYVTWKNEYPAGETSLNGVHVIRLKNARERNQNAFDKISQKAYEYGHSSETEKEWIDAQGPYCPEIVEFLNINASEYKAVLFMTYLYYTTAAGIFSGLDNIILIPTAHDEPPIRLDYYKNVFNVAKAIIYNTDEEKIFVEKNFLSTQDKPSCTVGFGIDEPVNFAELPDNLKGIKYIVYAGRIDESKGCKELFQYFRRYKDEYGGSLKLVLMGKAVLNVPKAEDIISLGFVSEELKSAVMRDAFALVLFSKYESLSIVVLEEMMQAKPVLVNGQCDVLRGHCTRSNAGLYFLNYQEFAYELNYLLEHNDTYQSMCRNGKKYVQAHYNWENIINKISYLIELI